MTSCSHVFGIEKLTICDSDDMWSVAKKKTDAVQSELFVLLYTIDVIKSKINRLQDGSDSFKNKRSVYIYYRLLYAGYMVAIYVKYE